MDRAKAIDKIKKCFAMAHDGRGEIEEMQTALRFAQRLMEQHGITERDVGFADYGIERVHVPIQVSLNVPMMLNRLASLIADAFGIKAVISAELRISDYSYVVEYIGRNDRVILAGYTHQVLFRAMNSAWINHLKGSPWLRKERGARAGFQMGFLHQVASKINDFAMTEQELAMTEAYKKHCHPTTDQAKPNKMGLNSESLRAGYASAKEFNLHRPMGQENLKLEAK